MVVAAVAVMAAAAVAMPRVKTDNNQHKAAVGAAKMAVVAAVGAEAVVAAVRTSFVDVSMMVT